MPISIPRNLLTRLVIPLITTSFLFSNEDVNRQQVETYDQVLRVGDEALSIARKEGDSGNNPEEFDYIVIGGGSAGAVVASRLSAVGTFSVLLLEGGGDPNPLADIPLARRHIWAYSSLAKGYDSVPQSNACLNNNGSCFTARAIGLGGCSVLNTAVYNRCNRNDYDSWAKFTKDRRWAWNNVVKGFKQIEDYHGFHEDNPGPSHGQGGEIYIGKIDYIPGSDLFLDAVAKEGIPIGGDFNSGSFPYGFSKIDYNLKKGLRQSSYHGFLLPFLNEEVRRNLTIYRYSWATKIRIDKISKRAVGVEYKRHGRMRYVKARKEVIVSGGALESPKLLMLSGIGPEHHLEQMGIDTVIHSPAVGNYLQDHIATDGRLHPFTINVTWDTPEFFTNESLIQYLTTGTGPLNSFEWGLIFGPVIAMGYIPSRLGDITWPDIQVYVIEEPLRKENNKNLIQQTIYFHHVLMRPESHGTIRLASRNPEDNPLIDFKIYQKGQDLERHIDGIQFTSKLMLESTVFKSLGIKWSDDINQNIPQKCKGRGIKFASRDYWRCILRETSLTHYHPTSSCRMGPNKKVAVVDSKFRVFGAKGLRVIDASAMPFVPSGNTNFPSMMLGHFGAELILSDA